MKNLSPNASLGHVLAAWTLAVLFFASLPVQAQIVVTDPGFTIGNTMPGSPTDFILFNSSNYASSKSTDNGTSTSQLSSFWFSGGVAGENSPGAGGAHANAFASITTPAGGSAIRTGGLFASGGSIAFAIEPGNPSTETLDGNLNPNFNYNDFNVFVMVSNTNSDFSDTSVSLVERDHTGPQNPAFTSNEVAITDDTTGTTKAEYIEFNVTGLQTAINDGYSPDLVLSAYGSGIHYIGGVSFKSAPEPSTDAMLLAGLALLGYGLRRRNAQVALAREV